MSFSPRENPYSFDKFLDWQNRVDYYTDDPFIQQIVKYSAGENWQEVDKAARNLSAKASLRWRDLADESARPEKRPYVQHYDAYNHRIERIVRPMESVVLEREVFSEGLFAAKTSALERLVAGLVGEVADLLTDLDLTTDSVQTRKICRRWDNFCHRLFHAYQDIAFAEVAEHR